MVINERRMFIMEENKNNASESKRDRFIRIAEARTIKIIDMLRLLGNCSSKSTYDYTEEDVKKIFSTIEKELKVAKNKFTETEEKEDKFSLR